MSAGFPAASSAGFDDWGAPGPVETSGFGEEPQGNSRRKKKDRKGASGFDDGFGGSAGDLGGFGGDLRSQSPSREPMDYEEPPRSRHSSRDRTSDRADIGAPSFSEWGTGRQRSSSREHHRSTSREQQREELAVVVAQFEAVMEADRTVSKQLKREIDDLEQELRQVHETRDQLERQLRQEADESQRFKTQQQELERRVEGAKNRLVDHREDRRAVNLESISLRRDRDHFADELSFLKRMAEEEEQTLDAIGRSNQFLDKSCKGLEAHTQQLELQRKEVLRQVATEREVARHEERENAETRNQIERMRREQAAAAMGRRDAHLREEKMREMQRDGPVQLPRSNGQRPADPYRPDGHSWANNLVGSGLPQPEDPTRRFATAPGNQQAAQLGVVAPGDARSHGPSPRSLTPAGPRSREGV